jgi:multiple sugar transport system permease protein
MGPLIYVSSPTKMPVAYALQLYQSVHGGEFGYLMAASTMVMLPGLRVFFFSQRYFIQGITLTGLKGLSRPGNDRTALYDKHSSYRAVRS